jgi:hypothetical protein
MAENDSEPEKEGFAWTPAWHVHHHRLELDGRC